MDVLLTHRPLGAPRGPRAPLLGGAEGLPVQVMEQLGEEEGVLETVMTTMKMGLVPGRLSHDEVLHVTP